jgi:hypothetical protein
MIYILRDPRDVVASHIERKFDRTLEMVCKAWNNYRLAFQKALNVKPHNCLLIRYEDLVSNPEKIIPVIMDRLSLELEPSLYRFYNSKAGVHSYGHPNADNLKKGFFTTSIQRWQKELSPNQIQEIEFRCKDGMIAHGYL